MDMKAEYRQPFLEGETSFHSDAGYGLHKDLYSVVLRGDFEYFWISKNFKFVKKEKQKFA